MLIGIQFLSNIPNDHYEYYPGINSAPLTVTLYKDGEKIIIDKNDPRLIRLINFYNNAVYNIEYSYSQGAIPVEQPNGYETLVKSVSFRLELTFDPLDNEAEDPAWRVNPDFLSDTLVFCYNTSGSSFVYSIQSDTPYGEGLYPFTVYMRAPLYTMSVNWLTLFGF